jgi:hypothetical protein
MAMVNPVAPVGPRACPRANLVRAGRMDVKALIQMT